ncbi:hypothetical protein [Methylopila sp. 73B]|uniref:hypothetical protein n=1 Tax=Methylopila sp. 73B TaxID=1120792 RepID=UPI00036F8EB6|nr:hypothetical protein [Methylopila sp. 73B]
MQKFYLTITSSASGVLAPSPGGKLSIYETGTTTLAALFEDDGTTAKANPLTADTNGLVQCTLANGKYDLKITVSGVDRWIYGLYVYDGTAIQLDLEMPTQFTVNGQAVEWKTVNANRGLFGPTTGTPDVPTFRSMVPADMPSATTSAQGAVQLADLAAIASKTPGRAIPANLYASAVPDLIIEDQKPQNTGGGGAGGTNTTRVLNTIVRNIIGATLGGNQFTLPAGTYYAEAWGIAQLPGTSGVPFAHRIQNLTDGITVGGIGASGGGMSGQAQYASNLPGLVNTPTPFAIVSPKAFALQMSSAGGTYGNAAGYGTETYAQVKVWKLA